MRGGTLLVSVMKGDATPLLSAHKWRGRRRDVQQHRHCRAERVSHLNKAPERRIANAPFELTQRSGAHTRACGELFQHETDGDAPLADPPTNSF
jgi:hypothetical protein